MNSIAALNRGGNYLSSVFGGYETEARNIIKDLKLGAKLDTKKKYLTVRGNGYDAKLYQLNDMITTLKVYAKDKEIMAIRHKKYKLEGVQFHPESILTFEGKKLLKNFLEL